MKHSNATNFDPRVECDECARWINYSESVKEWTGKRVCRTCVNPRDPADFIKIPPEDIAVKDARPPKGLPTIAESIAGQVETGEVLSDGTIPNGFEWYKPNGLNS